MSVVVIKVRFARPESLRGLVLSFIYPPDAQCRWRCEDWKKIKVKGVIDIISDTEERLGDIPYLRLECQF